MRKPQVPAEWVLRCPIAVCCSIGAKREARALSSAKQASFLRISQPAAAQSNNSNRKKQQTTLVYATGISLRTSSPDISHLGMRHFPFYHHACEPDPHDSNRVAAGHRFWQTTQHSGRQQGPHFPFCGGAFRLAQSAEANGQLPDRESCLKRLRRLGRVPGVSQSRLRELGRDALQRQAALGVERQSMLQSFEAMASSPTARPTAATSTSYTFHHWHYPSSKQSFRVLPIRIDFNLQQTSTPQIFTNTPFSLLLSLVTAGRRTIQSRAIQHKEYIHSVWTRQICTTASTRRKYIQING
ncbi:hypothetical protein BU26DRAFT_149845 [Trematosphaeria pertusa]|uniref:Uncharacterized protein n=1 Tax=Trematosphaeria pertusa TaxID=390896 RepID=A0A6A6IX32_9PLEO|nr:uncharacterized protein BU26DRAFT_149845 [Trematosphaeria pertusa]KAF2255029.1 hypothetical protein BU26DRAFT_149845 [Trematosphaeria pertusa]